MQTPPQSLIPQRRDWQFNALFVAAIVLLTNVVVTLVELLIVGQIGAHTLPIASVSGLTIATLVVCGTRWLRARDEIKHKASLQVGIEQAQRKLALAVDTAKIVFWELDIVTGRLDVVQDHLTWLGLRANTQINSLDALLVLLHPDDLTPFVQGLHAAMLPQSPDFEMDFRVQNEQGGWAWVHARGRVNERNAQGVPQRAVGSNINITQRKQAEEALQEQEFLLSELQRVGHIGAYVLNLETDSWTSSCVLNQIFGIEVDTEKTTASWNAIVHPDDRAMVLDYLRHEVIESRRPFNREYRIVRGNNGAIRWVWGRGELSLNPEGTPVKMIGTIQDITERKDTEATLRGNERYLHAILNAVGDPIFVKDDQSRILLVNDAFVSLFELTREEALGMTLTEHVDPVEREHFLRVDQQVLSSGQESSVEETLTLKGKRRGKDSRTLFTKKTRYTDDQGVHFLVGVIHDITERKQIEVRQKLAASVFTHAREGITITDPSGNIIDVNDMFTQITGYSREEVLGKNPRILQSGRQGKAFYEALWHELTTQGHWSGEVWNRRKNGEVYAEILTISAVRDDAGTTLHYVALFSDVTAIKAHQSELERMAHFDTLTGLPNRLLLRDRLQQAIGQCLRRDQGLAVVFLDLDNIKAINDTHGHEAGDAVLIAVSQTMQDVLREGDTLARIGGDEFVAILVDLDQSRDCVTVIERLLVAAATVIKLPASTNEASPQSEHSVRVSASIGVTLYPQDDVDADVLLRHADQAMYLAKQAGKNRYHLFDIANDAAIQSRHEDLKRISEALTQGEFVLYYQPKVNMRTGTVIGAEALIRWQHPERGLLPPGVFLPTIEDHLLGVEVGEWVIASALTQMSAWQAQGLDLAVSVNIGAMQLQQPNFPERLQAILAAHPDAAPQRLQLEILETSALDDIESVMAVMHACLALGVTFALDDFGTGYSSLTYLKHLPTETLKIDQSFIRNMTNSADDLAIVEGVIGLAEVFQRQVIAEGVETQVLGDLLLSIHCDLAQGYGVARPMPALDIPAWALKWQMNAAWTA